MRSILFKAKKLSDGKWVKGSLVKTPFGTFIEWYEDSICNKREVDTDTVCQSTGLKDCDGKEIWEHDLLKFITEREVIIGSTGIFLKRETHLLPLRETTIKDDKLVRWSNHGSKFDRKEGEK